jgi:hypothetical protein
VHDLKTMGFNRLIVNCLIDLINESISAFAQVWGFPTEVTLSLVIVNVVFFFLWYWGLNSGPAPWATPPALFCDEFFQDRVLLTICLCWLLILLFSASWVIRIRGMSHCYLTEYVLSVSWSRSWQTFSIKGQRVNNLGFPRTYGLCYNYPNLPL